jgi:hypothetical protein
MPEVIDGDIGGQSFAVGPSEIAAMPSEMDCLCFGTSRSRRPRTDPEFSDNSE